MLRTQLPPDLGRMIEDLLPEQERAQMVLPPEIMQHEVTEFIPLIDQAFIEVGYYHHGGTINRKFWLNKLHQLYPQAYTILTEGPNFRQAVELILSTPIDRTLNTILIMLGASEIPAIRGWIRDDEVMLLLLMLSDNPQSMCVNTAIMDGHFYLSALYLLQHGVKFTFYTLKQLLSFYDYPSQSRSELVLFLANHPETYNSPTPFLKWPHRGFETMYDLIAKKDPALAAQLVDAV